MRCACGSLFGLGDNAAREYAEEHLDEIEFDVTNWLVRYRCPDTGRLWLQDWPQSGLHGGGPSRLRQLDGAGEPMDDPGHDPFR